MTEQVGRPARRAFRRVRQSVAGVRELDVRTAYEILRRVSGGGSPSEIVLIGSRPPYVLARGAEPAVAEGTSRRPDHMPRLAWKPRRPLRTASGGIARWDPTLDHSSSAPDLVVFDGPAEVAGGQVLVDLLLLLPNRGRCVIARRADLEESGRDGESAVAAVRRLTALQRKRYRREPR